MPPPLITTMFLDERQLMMAFASWFETVADWGAKNWVYLDVECDNLKNSYVEHTRKVLSTFYPNFKLAADQILFSISDSLK